MRRYRNKATIILAISLLVLLAFGRSLFVAAEQANGPSLIISQLKITSSNGQFITLYNATNAAIDMSKFQLQYFNNYDLGKATSSRLIALTGTVAPHGYYMVNDSSMLLCYQLTVDSVSLGLSSTAGMIEVLGFNQVTSGSGVVPSLQDFVGWSKTAASGAQTLPANTNALLQRQPVDSKNNPLVNSAGSGAWLAVQPDPNNACALTTNTTNPVSISTGLNQLLPPSEAPAIIVSGSDDSVISDEPVARIPSADIGLMAPQITEILPNPDGTGNDATDEYIELYNANAASFDLSGFVLQTGLSSFHKYTFPAGTTLPGKTFKAFFSEDTGLSLSNTTSQAKLLDPLGNSISASEIYNKAKDGQAWALAKGKWYWTASPTPNAANLIKQPKTAAKTSKSASTKSKSLSGKKPKAGANKMSGSSLPSAYAEEAPKTPIHARVLALVAAAALLYGAYEYRADLASRIYQLRRYLGTRRANRQST